MLARILFDIFTISLVQGYLIERRIDHNNWKTLPDHIIIPASVCTLDGQLECLTMAAKWVDHCMCNCSGVSQTFLFLNGQWKCTQNYQVKENTGCTTMVTSTRETGSAIFTVPEKPAVTIEYSASIPRFDPIKCGLYRKSEYMSCDGSWIQSDIQTFNIAGKDKATITPSPHSDSTLQGRVIRLFVDCYFYGPAAPAESFCILFKVEGKRNCTNAIPSTANPVTTSATISSLVPVSTAVSLSTARSLPGLTTTPYNTIETTTRASSILSTVKQQSTSTSSTTLQVTTLSPLIQKTPDRPTADNKSAVIAGATVAALISIVIIIVVATIILGMKKRKSRRSSTTSNVIDNEGYTSSTGATISTQLSPRHDEEYSYPYYEEPIPKPHIRKELQSSIRNRVSDETENSVKHNNLDNKSEPVYNTLEGPEYTNPSAVSKEENLYSILEGPSEGSPDYQILEPPHYMPLKNYVPHIYGALIRPGNNEVGEDKIELESFA